jgi:hypothetical protein
MEKVYRKGLVRLDGYNKKGDIIKMVVKATTRFCCRAHIIAISF